MRKPYVELQGIRTSYDEQGAGESVPTSELAVVPGTSHGLLVEKPYLCNKIMIDFLTLEPAPTFAPIRRAE